MMYLIDSAQINAPGWIITSEPNESSRAIINFCLLPPDKLFAKAEGPEVFTSNF